MFLSKVQSTRSPKIWAQIIADTIADLCGTEPPDYSTHMVATADASGIILYNDAMNEDRDWTRWAVIHEMGHVFDHRRGTGTSVIQTGLLAGLIVYGTPSERMPLHVYNAKDESAGNISDYATTNASEDFAESWAATLFRGNWANMALQFRYPAPPARRRFIQEEIRAGRL